MTEPERLTATEAHVAGLAAAARTDEEIAAALALSPATLEAHLNEIYRKLAVRSRTELTLLFPAPEGTHARAEKGGSPASDLQPTRRWNR